MDAWLQAEAGCRPEELCANILGRLTIRMALSTVNTSASDPYHWFFHRVKDFGFKSQLLDRMRREFPDAELKDLNREFVDSAIIPAYTRAIETRRPSIDVVTTKILGVRVGYERLILPEKADGPPTWCISLAEGRFFIPPATVVKTDVTDDGIVQLLIEGQTAKEIAISLDLSPRTVEHRIDRLKARYEAKNLVHLIAKLVGAQVDRRAV